MTKAERRKPCANCPFRKEAPLAHWHPKMYMMLKSIGEGEGDFFRMRSFGCHKDKGLPPKEIEACVGWLLDQKKRGVPSLALRIGLSSDEAAYAQFAECEPDGEMYDSIEELVRVNLEADQDMNPHRYDEEGNYDPSVLEEDI